MFTAHLPLPSADEIQTLHRDGDTMRTLIKLRADVLAAVHTLEPETLLALARQYFPGESDYQATVKFGLEVMDALRALVFHGEDVLSMNEAERARLAPLVAEAGRRSLEIVRKLEGTACALRFMEGHTAERETNLRKAGVKGEELQRLMVGGVEDREARRTALNDERTALLAEQEALGKFLHTRNEAHLPEGFAVPEPLVVRATVPDVTRTVRPLHYANAHG